MAVRWDSVLVRALAGELEGAFSGARASALELDAEERRLSLHFRDATLDWWLHPERAGLRIGPRRAATETAFRLPAVLVSVTAPPDERLLDFRFRRVRGRVRVVGLHVELVPGRETAIVTSGAEQRTSGWLRAPRTPDGRVRMGQPYRPPAPTNRPGRLGELTEDEWTELADSGGLVAEVAWTSGLNTAYLLEPDRPTGWRRWQALARGEWDGAWVHTTSHGLQPYPAPLDGAVAERCSTLLDAFTRAADDDVRGLATSDARAWRREVERRRRKLRAIEREAERQGRATELRTTGDLILARLGQLSAGSSQVVIEGFDGTPVELTLDPALSPAENARVFYRKASRAERALAELPERAQAAAQALREAEEAVAALESGTAPAMPLPPGAAPAPSGRGDRTGVPAPPYRRFRTSGGLEVRVGRGAAENDALTFRHSRPDDVWLHARQAGGAHVILRWTSSDAPPARDLEEAAILAALHSKARHSATVPVDWTRRKYVRKPRGAAKGTVAVEREKTLFVEPDPEALSRLRPDATST